MTGSCGCSDHEIEACEILQRVRDANRKSQIWDFRQTDFASLRSWVGGFPMEADPKSQKTWGSWKVFKVNVLQG